ncbi:MAG: acetate kinase [Sediminicola sp.]
MNILILNSGSSSIKYQLISMPSEKVLGQGTMEKIGSTDAIFKFGTATFSMEEILFIKDHDHGLRKMVDILTDPDKGIVERAGDIHAVGHRVVHGGNLFSGPTLVDQKVKDDIRDLFTLAPLHNPHNWAGIELAGNIFEGAVQVAVFDTAFHQTMPSRAKRYALPNALFLEHTIQAYGFHGISHKYVSGLAVEYLDKATSKVISVHLGNGCSMTAVVNGQSMDHSLGFTPANGLIMGTRSGDIDHSIIFHLVHNLEYALKEVEDLLLRESGMFGLTGFNDLRDVEAAAAKGDEECLLALEMNAYRIKKYIGAYAAAMNGLDAIVFTAGIGENSSTLRKLVCDRMEYLGIILDADKNVQKSIGIHEINTLSSPVKILVVPTNEELEIARQAFGLVKGDQVL